MTSEKFRELESKLRLKKHENAAREAGPHETTCWYDKEHPERLHLLIDIIGERMSEDSEDPKGNKVYKKERCPRFK